MSDRKSPGVQTFTDRVLTGRMDVHDLLLLSVFRMPGSKGHAFHACMKCGAIRSIIGVKIFFCFDIISIRKPYKIFKFLWK